MFPFDVLSPIINKVLDFIPDPQKKAEAQAAAMKAAQDHETEILKVLQASDAAQNAVNEEEAKSESKFKSCWRPAFGWVGVIGFAYSVVIQPCITFFLTLKNGHPPALPTFDNSLLQTLCFGLLGLGAYRTYEKKLGVN